MSIDIERLRRIRAGMPGHWATDDDDSYQSWKVVWEALPAALDEIETLRARITELEAALRRVLEQGAEKLRRLHLFGPEVRLKALRALVDPEVLERLEDEKP